MLFNNFRHFSRNAEQPARPTESLSLVTWHWLPTAWISDFRLLGYGRRALPTLRPYPPTLVEAFARRASTIPPHPMVWVTVKIPSKSCSAVNNPRNNPFQTPKFNPNCGPLGERQAASWRAPKNKENRDLWSQKPQKCLARRR